MLSTMLYREEAVMATIAGPPYSNSNLLMEACPKASVRSISFILLSVVVILSDIIFLIS